ncbi:hypothetical protein NAG22_24565, partial [Pseudomonas aeruginosa]|nr:hypothetical protein [Pseudomonas aeruginosa]
YIRRVRAAVRVCCWSGRALLMFGWLPPTWLLGSLLLGLGKILENMELGHNVMHGQYDWMNDPEFAGRAYEWDIAGPSDFWRHTHNHIHHTYTNVLGKDDDVGYGVVRLFPEQRWKPFYRWQPLWVTLQALLFQYAVAIQHLRLDKYAKGRLDKAELMPLLRRLRAKLGRQWTKDYLLFPLLGLFAGGFGAVFVGNLLANVLRNLWTFTVIFCGHFTEKAVVFPPSVLEGETRGHWYLLGYRWPGNVRQLRHVLRYACALCGGATLQLADLPAELRGEGRTPASACESGGGPERDALLDALVRHRWKPMAAARELGISRATLYRRVRRHGIRMPGQADD